MIPTAGNDNYLSCHLFDNLTDAVFLFEWTNENAPGQFIEVNQRACDWLGYTRDELLSFTYKEIHAPEHYSELLVMFRGLEPQAPLLFATQLLSKTGRRIPVEVSARLVQRNDRPVVICIARAVTARHTLETELRRHLEVERVIADISTQLARVTPADFETTTSDVLQRIGEFIAVDRCYLTVLVEGTHIIESSLEWCAPSIVPAGTRYNGINLDRFAWTLAHFERNEAIRVDDVAALPPQASPEREIWSQTNIQSLVAIPIFLEDALAAYLGFNIEHCPVEHQWSDTDFRLLRVMADLFASVLARKRYEARRAALNHDLERAVGTRTAQLRESEMRSRALARQVVLAQEAERRRIARELHDDAGQALNVLKIHLNLLRGEMVGDTQRQARHALDDALDLADRALTSIHNLAQGLRPAGLDTVGLHLSLEELCREFARHTRLDIKYQGEPVTGLSDAATIALYRFLQEALTNALKHAHCQSIEARLRRDAQDIVLTVRDDGCGFDPQAVGGAASDRLGLRGMCERFEMLGGTVTIESRVGEGTRLTARVAVEEEV